MAKMDEVGIDLHGIQVLFFLVPFLRQVTVTQGLFEVLFEIGSLNNADLPGIHCVTQADLELTIPLPQPGLRVQHLPHCCPAPIQLFQALRDNHKQCLCDFFFNIKHGF